MSTINALDKYANAVKALNDHKEANSAVFNAHQTLLYAVIDAENDLRDQAAEAGVGAENDEYKVTVTPQTMKVYDEEKLKVMLSSEKFAEVVTEQVRPSRITISPKARQ